MRETPNMPVDPYDEEELYEEMMAVASSTECTGLVPTPPVTNPEVSAYSEIYDSPLSKDDVLDMEDKQ